MKLITGLMIALTILVSACGPSEDPPRWNEEGLIVDRKTGFGKPWVMVGYHDGTAVKWYVTKTIRNRCRTGEHWPMCRKGPFAK